MSYTMQVSHQTNETKIYYGVCEKAFKFRQKNHKKIFNNIKYQTNTELSNDYWNIISANKLLAYPGKLGKPQIIQPKF